MNWAAEALRLRIELTRVEARCNHMLQLAAQKYGKLWDDHLRLIESKKRRGRKR